MRAGQSSASGITETAVTSAPHGFCVTGEWVHVEPQYCHSIKIHCQTLLLPFIYARCETSLKTIYGSSSIQTQFEAERFFSNKATGKRLLQAGRAALTSNYFGAKMCAFVCNEKHARLLLCVHSSKFHVFLPGQWTCIHSIGRTVAYTAYFCGKADKVQLNKHNR